MAGFELARCLEQPFRLARCAGEPFRLSRCAQKAPCTYCAPYPAPPRILTLVSSGIGLCQCAGDHPNGLYDIQFVSGGVNGSWELHWVGQGPVACIWQSATVGLAKLTLYTGPNCVVVSEIRYRSVFWYLLWYARGNWDLKALTDNGPGYPNYPFYYFAEVESGASCSLPINAPNTVACPIYWGGHGGVATVEE